MPGMPAKCSRCGLVFETKEWGASGPFVELSLGRMPVKCQTPHCLGPAYIIEGTFRPETDGSITAISIPTASVGDFLRLRKIMEKLKKSVPSEKELLDSVEAISPALAETIKPYVRAKGILFIIAVIAWLISHINFEVDIKTSIEIDGKINLNDVFQYAVAEVEKHTAGVGPAPIPAAPLNASEPKQSSQPQETQRPTKRQLRRIRGRTKTTQPRP